MIIFLSHFADALNSVRDVRHHSSMWDTHSLNGKDNRERPSLLAPELLSDVRWTEEGLRAGAPSGRTISRVTPLIPVISCVMSWGVVDPHLAHLSQLWKEGRYEKEFDGSASAVLSELNFNLFGSTSSCFFLVNRRTRGRERLGVEFHPLAQK